MAKKNKNVLVVRPIIPVMKHVKPVSIHQHQVCKAFNDKYHVCLFGSAGTGKTYLSLYLALKTVLSGSSPYEQVIIIRSVVPTRELGFLPGSIKEKIEIYEAPYREICQDFFDDPHAYSYLKSLKKIDFQTTSHLRGLTFKNAIVIVDEMQNLSYHELATTITRAGDNCYYMYSGDTLQSDLRYNEQQGIHNFLKILKNMPSFQCVKFDQNDIVRGDLVREFLTEENNLFETRADVSPS